MNETDGGKHTMRLFEAVQIAVGEIGASKTKQIEAWQFLIATGAVWNLQAWFGRRACELIASGACTLAPGATIPARAQALINTARGKRHTGQSDNLNETVAEEAMAGLACAAEFARSESAERLKIDPLPESWTDVAATTDRR